MGPVLERIRSWLVSLRPVNFLRVLPWIPRASKPLTAILLLVVIISAVLPAAFIAVSGALIGTVPEALRGGMSSPAGGRLTALLVALGVALVAQQVAGPVLTLVTNVLADRVTLNAADDVMEQCLAPAGIAHLEDPATLNAVAMARGVGSLGWGPGQATKALVALATRKLGALLSVGLLLAFSPLLVIALLVAWLWTRRGTRLEVMRSIQVHVGNVESHRLAGYYRGLSFGPSAAKETRIFDLGPWVLQRFTNHWEQALAELRKARRGGMVVNIRLAVLHGGTQGGALVLLIWAAMSGDISLGQFAAYAQAVMASSLLLAGIHDDDVMLEWASAALPAAESLRKLASVGGVEGGGAPPIGPTSAITFEGVRFSYPGSSSLVFDGLDLEIPAGKSLAVVGLNGAGKTTLIKLLARLYDPLEGAVRVDGVDLRELDPRQWQRQVGAIFQDFVRFELPARENVGFGAHEYLGDTPGLDLAAAKAGVSGVIKSLPAGWDTILSRAYAGGTDLSGGEWQKIALARALFAVRGGASVLVLDEPTANLDVRSEAEIFDRFLEVTSGCTTVLVSHRFSTVRHADRICVIEEGRVVELGSHEELMASAGRYAEMFNLQAARFEAEVLAGEPS